VYRQKQFKRQLAWGLALLTLGICLLQPGFRLELVRGMIYLESGRVWKDPSPTQLQSIPQVETESTEPVFQEGQTVPVFGAGDLSGILVHYSGAYRPELESLMTKPLRLSLYQETPTVLILHSHGTEAYSHGNYVPWEPFRTLDDTANMIAVGDEVARVLECCGISVIHDRNAYDYPDYNAAYTNARSAAKQWLQQYPSIQLVLDLHRDAGLSHITPLYTEATVSGQKAAQLMMVVGTDENGNHHPAWRENLSLALKLTALLERNHPGICRPIDLRLQRFNMDLSPGWLLVEVGAEGNTFSQAQIAAHALAQAIVALARGANLTQEVY